MQPRIQLAFWAASAHCEVMLSSIHRSDTDIDMVEERDSLQAGVCRLQKGRGKEDSSGYQKVIDYWRTN